MNKFKSLFGVAPEEIKENCVLMPFISKDALAEFKIKKLIQGKLYACQNSGDFSFIHSRVGPAFTGDAVLYLKETRCKNTILFGSCGLVDNDSGLSIGSLAVPGRCYSSESFSEILINGKIGARAFYPRPDFLASFLKVGGSQVKEVVCATVASLKLEEEIMSSFRDKKVEVVDMESSAFFAAAKNCDFNAAAIFYISDILRTHPFYKELTPGLKLKLSISVKSAANLICEFFQMNSAA